MIMNGLPQTQKLTIIFILVMLGAYAQENHISTTQPEASTASEESKLDTGGGIKFLYPMKNFTRFTGESLNIKCHLEGDPPVNEIVWLKNEAPLHEEKGRIKIKFKIGSGSSQWSRVRIRDLEPMDTGFYRCEASNGIDMVSAESMVKVHLKSKVNWPKSSVPGSVNGHHAFDYEYHDENTDDDFGIIPHSSSIDFGTGLGGSGISGLPSQVEFQGRSPSHYVEDAGAATASSRMSGNSAGIPNLTPNENFGSCQRYSGDVCSKYIGSNHIFVSQGLTQSYVESKLKAAFAVIMNSPELSKECAKFAIPAVCLSTLPLCDMKTQRPRKVSSSLEVDKNKYLIKHFRSVVMNVKSLSTGFAKGSWQ